eukprot:TRINITY_DN113823_c0_g1_i1.p1 TRINITY_DN113823_c0_g1~~TRINITY_DN113823_c0_g1_i1.p1  ORF type:complete len:155 (+),score=24.09 TRINITY_DN113823_c0_g1_i1:29-466(+)
MANLGGFALRDELWGQMRVPLRPTGLSSCASDCSTTNSSGQFGLLDVIHAKLLACDEQSKGYFDESWLNMIDDADAARAAELQEMLANSTCRDSNTCLSWDDWKLLQEPLTTTLRDWATCKGESLKPIITAWLKDRAESLFSHSY